jgi:5-deoxy-5-amino-3-dehydroquinate synthase
MRRVTVGVDPPYDVVVAPDALGSVGELVRDRRRVHVVSQSNIWDLWGERLSAALTLHDPITTTLMDDGERAKTLDTVESLCRAFAGGGLLRNDVVIAFGGGVVTDTVGFAAAVYHRGVALVQVPTTLLAQVDASIGGKTAVNLPEGKNLVGAFHQPIGVVAAGETLATLPDREMSCGLGEVAKYALMPEGAEVAAILERDADRVRARDTEVLAELVAACAAIKAGIVASDPEEHTGRRAVLNYGHTLAHALETAGDHALAHGEAVAIGLVFAANLAYALERVGPDVPQRVQTVLTRLELPTAVSPGISTAGELIALMRRDKKAKGGLTFVLPGAGALETVDDPPQAAIDAALRSVGVEA